MERPGLHPFEEFDAARASDPHTAPEDQPLSSLWVLLVLLLLAWLLAPVVLLILWLVSRGKAERLERELQDRPAVAPEAPPPASSPQSDANHEEVLLMRLELRRQQGLGHLTQERHAMLEQALDGLLGDRLAARNLGIHGDEWTQRRDEIWNRLVAPIDAELETAPWNPQPDSPSADQPAASVATEEPQTSRTQSQAQLAQTGLAGESTMEPPAPAPAIPEPVTVAPALDPEPARQPYGGPPETSDFVWEPAEPNALERWLATASGWPRLLAPFLAQNIGWFIGGFCFVSGTVFLLSYTEGFANALAVVASLAIYTSALLAGGYQIRKRRPELERACTVLLTIGLLLAPLNLAAIARALAAASGSSGALIVTWLLALVATGALYFAARVGGGLLDRSLDRSHARLFTALSVSQLAGPAIDATGNWIWLAAAQAIVMIGFGTAVVRFDRHWLHATFVEGRRSVWLVASLLAFAALVSVVHLWAGFGAALPRGYAGPFLMALGAIGFHLDAGMKEHAHGRAFLSRAIFALYALSIVAVIACAGASVPQSLTLAMGAAVYLMVLWRYATVPPLYLMLACMTWLYYTFVLARVADGYGFIASLPALAGLTWLVRTLEPRSDRLARASLIALGLLAASALVWTLMPMQHPQWIAVVSILIAAAGARAIIAGVANLLGADEDGELPARWRYLITGLVIVALAFTPVLTESSRFDQIAIGAALLSALWVGYALHRFRELGVVHAQALINSALVAILLAVTLGATMALDRQTAAPESALTLGLCAAVLSWLALRLRLPGLLYLAMLGWGLTGAMVKMRYFPGSSYGFTELALATAIWGLLRWLDRNPALAMPPPPPQIHEPPLRVMAVFEAHPRSLRAMPEPHS